MKIYDTLVLALSILLLTFFTSVLAIAETDRDGAILLMKSLNDKETNEGVLPQHQSEIIESATPSCNTILMLHGLYESKYYMKGITSYYTSRGFNVVHILSTGHFRPHDRRMQNAKFTDWRNDAVLGLNIAKKLSSNVFLFGYSTGGTMAADLAIHYPQDIKGLFLFAPALKLTGRTQFLVSSGKLLGFYPGESCDGNQLSRFCKIIGSLSAGSVKNAIPLLKEGLSWSPLAGVEVLNYTAAVARRFMPPIHSTDPHNNFFPLLDAYKQISAPLFLAVDHGDLTVDTDFSIAWFERLAQTKSLVTYTPQQGIAHTNIIKYQHDAYKHSPDFYNRHTDDLEKQMDEFLTQVNPTCQ